MEETAPVWYIEHLDTRRRALIVIHSSAPITRTD